VVSLRELVNLVQLWGVFKGLNLARAKNFSHVVLHVDSLVVVHSITKDSKGNARG